LFLLVCLSSLGLPGLNGFVGEFLVLVGAFQVNGWLAAVATTGIIVAAVYLLWMYQRVAFGEIRHEANRHLRDLTPREWALLVPVVVMIVWIGVYPRTFTSKTEATIQALIAQVESKASVANKKVEPLTIVAEAERSQEPSRTGHPRFKPAAAPSLQPSRQPSRSGQPRFEPASRLSLQ
jgi:formate hydrogenlyase subunit 3/multisubunit Na+/H+ antiporter MnhD subunit